MIHLEQQFADLWVTLEYLGTIASSISADDGKPLEELPNKSELTDLLGNSPTAKDLRQQRGYFGHIRPKTIKGRVYYYWIYYEDGKRVEKYLGVDRDRAIAKAKQLSKQLIDTPRTFRRNKR
jgi:hypothetical protein